MIWTILFAIGSAFFAYDAYRSSTKGVFTLVRSYADSTIVYARSTHPHDFWMGIGLEVISSLLLAAAAAAEFPN